MLNLFPPGSLSQSVITTVWLGIWVIVFFNLRLGWSLSGLIIPGYLVPLMVLKPVSATVILLEGVVTYVLGAFLFKVLPRWGIGWSVFGRDRFFMLVLLSVIVRVLGDGFVLPWVLTELDRWYSIPFEVRGQLHSFGLIIVALIANYFWGQGVRRGFVPFGVVLTVTYLLVRFVLLPYTNFSISNVEYLYEDVAGDILAAPKAYIILITAAFIASRMNLLYGWEFNGILVPSLMALLWYQPAKLVISLLEAALVLGMGTLLLRSRLFAGVTVEGARKLLLFFNIGFLYKMGLGFLLAAVAPDLKTTDFFGIGYLITTLLAVKMHDKDLLLPMTRATLQVSFTAALIANGIGFLLTYVPHALAVEAPEQERGLPEPAGRFTDLNRHMPLMLYRGNAVTQSRRPDGWELVRFGEALTLLLDAPADSADATVAKARERLRGLGYGLSILEDRWFYLHETEPVRGWGLYLIDSRPQRDLLLQVNAPLEESLTLPAGLNLFRRLGARVLAVNGTSTQTAQAVAVDPLGSPFSFYSVCRRLTGAGRTLQLREQTLANRRILAANVADYDRRRPEALLFVKRAVPEPLPLQVLATVVGEFQTYFSHGPFDNYQRDQVDRGFVELFLDRSGLRRLLAAPVSEQPEAVVSEQLGEPLELWAARQQDGFAAAGGEAYQAPDRPALLLMNDMLLNPLHTLVFDYETLAPEQFEEDLRFIAGRAAALGWSLQRAETADGAPCLLLHEGADRPRRHQGFYVFRLGASAPYSLTVARPVFERHTLDLGLSLFAALRARALLVHGAHFAARRDGAADALAPDNRFTVLNQVYQSLHKAAFDEAFLAVQVRGWAPDPALHGDTTVVAAFDRGVAAMTAADGLARQLVDRLRADGERVALVDGGAATAGYGLGGSPQRRYLAHLPNHHMAALRFSDTRRNRFRDLSDTALTGALAALAIPTLPLEQLPLFGNAGGALPAEQVATLRRFTAYGDVTALAALQADSRLNLFHGFAEKTGARFLLVTGADGRPKALANLAVREPDTPIQLDAGRDPSAQITRFIQRREGLLLFGATP
ncbi:poly-gamma-glutamate biosynthesis protein PgsC/CapC [Acanthopleuribacter pedis]|uniref:Poly-gamma-glutamate biosynthesis protein PgsC/CapC n=1 Tax=Acanthopleuribacter pedis TaxID=442870 RepID=A0A8J7QAY4_9BACT|nr:poly-gamma-glutamate biosynthesis protein PgsC/CapC [Acanthopleuribacter pedis]